MYPEVMTEQLRKVITRKLGLNFCPDCRVNDSYELSPPHVMSGDNVFFHRWRCRVCGHPTFRPELDRSEYRGSVRGNGHRRLAT